MCVQEVLVEQRTALSDLLQQLLKQRDQREQELRQVLVSKLLLSPGLSGHSDPVRCNGSETKAETALHVSTVSCCGSGGLNLPHPHPLCLSQGSLEHINSSSLIPANSTHSPRNLIFLIVRGPITLCADSSSLLG